MHTYLQRLHVHLESIVVRGSGTKVDADTLSALEREGVRLIRSRVCDSDVALGVVVRRYGIIEVHLEGYRAQF